MRLFVLIRSYFKRKLPVGMTEFHAWADRIISLAGKFADEDSLKFALASAVIHAKHDMASIEDQYFVRLLRKAAANQVASQLFQDIKAKQAAAAQPVEVTTQPIVEVAANGQQAQNETQT
jgi:thiamine pyrophosphate-dependent acetolactate synthase large subunit-like protein